MLELLQAVDQRIEANLEQIQRAMEICRAESEVARIAEDAALGLQRGQVFDRDLHTLSEMPLCTTLMLPSGPGDLLDDLGFKVRRGVVFDTKNEHNPGINHFFWLNTVTHRAGLVVCIVPGYLVIPAEPITQKGENIKALMEKAPTLLRMFGDEVTVLRGSRTEITQSLNLFYLTSEELRLLS